MTYSLEFERRTRTQINRRIVVCNSCGIPKEKIRKEASGKPKDQWVDTRGFLWNGNTCRDCMLVVKLKRRRRAGVLPREDVSERRFIKATNAEKTVADWFKSKGFSVVTTTGNGPDLTCSAGQISICVEVKSVSSSKAKGHIYWCVGPVYENRQNDDLIAIVLPSGRIHFEDMKSHLLKCRQGGMRTVTTLVREDMELEAKHGAI